MCVCPGLQLDADWTRVEAFDLLNSERRRETPKLIVYATDALSKNANSLCGPSRAEERVKRERERGE